MLLLAAVVVLVLAATAIVASGRWGSMPALVDDRPFRLPSGQEPVGAEALRDIQFSVVPRGYSPEQVDGLLERLARQLENDGPGAGAAPERRGDRRSDSAAEALQSVDSPTA